MAEDAESDIYLYVLNPSSEYWYEALPQAAFDWDYGSEDNAVYQYLRRNAASSRAMIERVWTFLNLEGGADFVGMEPETKPDDPVAVTHTRHFFDPVTERLQDLKLESPQDADAYFVDPGKDTFLKALQRSVLTLKTAQGEMPDPADGSVIVGRAPSLIREVETLVDWLQYIFRTQKDVTPADVLVVTPDIEGAAGVIEAVMNAQPESRKIAWTIADDRVSDRAMALETWKALAELLFSRADASDLEAWLEMPQAQKRWQMTADDLALIHAWLVAGGYRFGFSEAHIERLVSEGEADAADTDGRSRGLWSASPRGFFSAKAGSASSETCGPRRARSAAGSRCSRTKNSLRGSPKLLHCLKPNARNSRQWVRQPTRRYLRISLCRLQRNSRTLRKTKKPPRRSGKALKRPRGRLRQP